jgi:hypothetical protein
VSYFVIPFQSHARTWVTIGMEAVVAQAFQAVYPVSHGFVFAYPDGRAEASRAIRRLADDLRAGEYGRHAARTLTFGDHLRRADDSMLDAAMLTVAADQLKEGRPLFVRTQLLSPSMHPRVLHHGFAWLDQRIIRDRWIVGVDGAGPLSRSMAR